MSGPYPLDTLGLWEATAGLPEQIESSLSAAAAAWRGITPAYGVDVSAVVVLGMGNSGLAGEVAAAVDSRVPIVVNRGFEIPDFVGPRTLVLAVSWCGDTVETLRAAESAIERGAIVIVASAGGALLDLARANDLMHLELPGDLPVSRAAFGAATSTVLFSLSHAGLIGDLTSSLATAAVSLSRRRDAWAAKDGAAAVVARRIGRTIPLIYGSSGLGAVAARRWKTQINENAKAPAFEAVTPELTHNEIAGWGQNGDMTRQVLSLVSLREPAERAALVQRIDAVNDALDEVMADVISVWADGGDALGRMFDLVMFGDFVSLHLAGREGTDPGPTPLVDDVRRTPL